MILADLFLVIIFAAILSAILGWGFGWRHPTQGEAIAQSFLFLFIILLFTTWAGVVWLPPWGPVFLGTPWLNILLLGVLVSLLILGISAPPGPHSRREEDRDLAAVGATFGLFFWILIMSLLVAIIVSYIA